MRRGLGIGDVRLESDDFRGATFDEDDQFWGFISGGLVGL